MRMKLVCIVCILSVIFAASLFSTTLAQNDSYNLEWQRSLPGLSGITVISTSDGGYLALGEDASYNSTTGTFYGSHPVVAKTDADGNVVWSKTVVYEEGNRQTRLSQLVEVNDGYIIGGVVDEDQYSSSQHFCVIKMSDEGNIVWRTLGTFERTGDYFQAGALTATTDGGCLLVGSFSYAAPSVPTLVLTRVNGNGQLEYSKTLSADTNPIFPWVSGSVNWAIQTSDGGFLLLNNQGQSHPISPSATSLMKIDSSGNIQWTKTYGGGGNYYHTTGVCAVALSDGYLIGGMAAPESQWSGGIIIRTDAAGNMLWNRTFTNPNYVYSAINSTQGGFLLLSTGIDPNDSKVSHIWLWETNSEGEIQTQRDLLKVNTSMLQGVSQLAPTKDSGFVFTGSFFYERSNEPGGSTLAVNKFWIAKVSVSGHGESLGDSGFPVLEVAAGIAFATVLAVLLCRKYRAKRRVVKGSYS
jgi:hypothetical protein